MKRALLALTLVVVSLLSVFLPIDKSNHSIGVAQPLMIGDVVAVEHIVPYLNIAKNISLSNNYDSNRYNCWDYATGLKRALLNAGYNDTKIVAGIVDCNSSLFDMKICKLFGGSHNWIELKLGNQTIWIEATNGQIITEEEKQFYKFGSYSTEKHNYYLNTKK